MARALPGHSRPALGAAGLVGGERNEALPSRPGAACGLTAEQEEGPFYVDLEKVRADIVEGQAGCRSTCGSA